MVFEYARKVVQLQNFTELQLLPRSLFY